MRVTVVVEVIRMSRLIGFTLALLLAAIGCGDSASPPIGEGASDTHAEPDTIPDSASDTAVPDVEDDSAEGDTDAEESDAPEPDADVEPDPDAEPDADAAPDADGDATPDAPEPDADAAPDAPEPDGDADAAPDAPEPDVPEPDSGAECSYLDLSIWIVGCDGGYRYLREWTEIGGASPRECPPYYTLGPDRFEDLESALESDACDDACLAAAATSVSYIRCGRRSGYIIYRSEGRDCPELYEFSEGIFESFEAYDEAHPCE